MDGASKSDLFDLDPGEGKSIEAWIKYVDDRISKRRAHNRRRPYAFGFAAICFFAIICGLLFNALEVSLGIFFGFTLIGIFLELPKYLESDGADERRLVFVKQLSNWLAQEVEEGTKFYWKISLYGSSDEVQAWLIGRFSLPEGHQLAVQVERVTKDGGVLRVGRARESFRERISVELKFYEAPSEPAMRAFCEALDAEGMALDKIEGRRARASFTGPEAPLSNLIRGVDFDESAPLPVGLLSSKRAAGCIESVLRAARAAEEGAGTPLKEDAALPKASAEPQERPEWEDRSESENVAAGGDWPLQVSAAPRRAKLRFASVGFAAESEGGADEEALEEAPSARPKLRLAGPAAERLSARRWVRALKWRWRSFTWLRVWFDRLMPFYLPAAAALWVYGVVRLFPDSRAEMKTVWQGIVNLSLSQRDIQALIDAQGPVGIMYGIGGFSLALVGLVALSKLSEHIVIKAELRRLLLPRVLISWLRRELKSGTGVSLAIEPIPHRLDAEQRWMDCALVLQDGTELELCIDLGVREGATELSEQLSVKLQLSRAPARARVDAVSAALRRRVEADDANIWERLAEPPPPELIDFEVKGSHVRALFETPWKSSTGLFPELREEGAGAGSRPSVIPAGWTLRMLSDLFELLPGGLPEGLKKRPKIRA